MNFQTFISDNDLVAIRATSAFRVEDILSFAEDAAELYLYDYLSEEFCREIIQNKVDDQKVVELFKKSLLNYSAVVYSDDGIVNITTASIAEANTKDQKPVRESILKRFKANRLRVANKKLDLLLAYLEKNKAQYKFRTWTNSAAYTVLDDCVIKTLDTFQRYIFLNNSRLAFISLKPGMISSYENDIQPLLERYNKVLTSLTPREKYLVEQAIANTAFATGVASVIAITDELVVNNLTVEKWIETTKIESTATAQASLQKLNELWGATPVDNSNPTPFHNPDSETYRNDPKWRIWGTGLSN